jgi:hypothetical protein
LFQCFVTFLYSYATNTWNYSFDKCLLFCEVVIVGLYVLLQLHYWNLEYLISPLWSESSRYLWSISVHLYMHLHETAMRWRDAAQLTLELVMLERNFSWKYVVVIQCLTNLGEHALYSPVVIL